MSGDPANMATTRHAVRPYRHQPVSDEDETVDGVSTQRTVKCPVRPGEPCTLCQLDVTGPQDCGLVYLVMHDPELRAGLQSFTADRRRTRS
jgi:hypothetical protein